MKRSLFFIIIAFEVCFTVRAQNEAQISQYMFYRESYSPASIAENDLMTVSGLYRLQWVSFPRAPKTFYFTFNTPLTLGSKRNTVGLIFSNDQAGAYLTQAVNFQYAYKFPLASGHLSIGTNIGFISQTIAGDSLHVVDSDYHDDGDVIIPTKSVNDVAFDIALGLYYWDNTKYFGLSLVHLPEPILDLESIMITYIPRMAYFTGGYIFQMLNPKYVLTPSLLVKTDFVTFQAEANVNLEYNQKYWGGISYRFQDAVVLMAGMRLSNGLTIGYSVDIPTSKIIANSFGSHEIVLSYSFSTDFNRVNRYKSIRIL